MISPFNPCGRRNLPTAKKAGSPGLGEPVILFPGPLFGVIGDQQHPARLACPREQQQHLAGCAWH